MAVALVALDAVVHIKSPSGGERKVAAGDFHLLPGKTPHNETVVEPGELITYVTIPNSKFAARSAYVKLRDRASYEFALASAGAALELQGNKIRTRAFGAGRRGHQAMAIAGSRARSYWRCGR